LFGRKINNTQSVFISSPSKKSHHSGCFLVVVFGEAFQAIGFRGAGRALFLGVKREVHDQVQTQKGVWVVIGAGHQRPT